MSAAKAKQTLKEIRNNLESTFIISIFHPLPPSLSTQQYIFVTVTMLFLLSQAFTVQ